MGTAKRERQKANRQLRLEELAKQARKQKTKRFGMRVTVVIVLVVALVALIALFSGDDKATTAATTTTGVPESTTTLVPIDPPSAKPTVSIPATNPTELKVTTITEGSGPKTATGDIVRVYYVGVLSKDGTEFDNNYDKGQTLDVKLGAGMVIQGWEQGLVGLQKGGRYQIDIPAELGYGATDIGLIPPNSALTFVVDIVDVIPGDTSATTTTSGGSSTTAGATSTTAG